MLALDPPGVALPTSLLVSPGGFFWWYADVIDREGNGLVCIWSWGLPFLPGRASAWRAGRPELPQDRPSINLAVYRDHAAVAYHLLEVPPAQASWTPDRWQVGGSSFELRRSGARAELEARLELPVPGGLSPLRGGFTLRGPPASWETPPPAAPDAHRWAPILGPCEGEVELHVGEAPLLQTHGAGYHDRNGCPVALDALGMEHWIWGRSAVGDRTVIYYLSFPEDPASSPHLLVAASGPDGQYRFCEARCDLQRPRRGRFGMPWWTTLVIEGLEAPLRVEVAPPLDDGPFYLRGLTQCTLGEQRGPGFIELCRPARVDRPWMRPLVQMAVQHAERPGSWWLPLFCGPTSDRVQRLWRWWWTRLGGGS
jgi:carotenoid 1,2-hydratase